jgi:hypothetical protein
VLAIARNGVRRIAERRLRHNAGFSLLRDPIGKGLVGMKFREKRCELIQR